jgi:hypothetical protein
MPGSSPGMTTVLRCCGLPSPGLPRVKPEDPRPKATLSHPTSPFGLRRAGIRLRQGYAGTRGERAGCASDAPLRRQLLVYFVPMMEHWPAGLPLASMPTWACPPKGTRMLVSALNV